METREVEITRILNPTSIDLGEYVINPYKGCELSCLYCYVRHNKVTQRDKRRWGEYVDIRVNAPSLLEQELPKRKPHRVLLGSTTECFQSVEKKWHITKKVIEILNRHRVVYTILTRSPLLLEALPLLKEGFCEAVYFTVNQVDEPLKRVLEPKSASFEKRIEAIQILLEANIPVIPYFSPVLPFISDFSKIFFHCRNSNLIEFEGLNFNLGNINEIIACIGTVYPQLRDVYNKLAVDSRVYEQIFGRTKKEIVKEAIKAKKNHRIFIHKLHSYFENTYLRHEGIR